MAANMVGRNEAPAVGFGAPTSQFGRPQSASGYGARPGTGAANLPQPRDKSSLSTGAIRAHRSPIFLPPRPPPAASGFGGGGMGPQTVHAPGGGGGGHSWDVRPGTASSVPSASAFGRSQAIGPTRRELLQEVARENGGETWSLDGGSAFGGNSGFPQRSARNSSGDGDAGSGFAGWNEGGRARGGGGDDDDGRDGKSRNADGSGNFGPGIRSPPSSPPPPPVRAGKALYTTQNLDTSDIRAFLMEPGPKNGSILCHIRREKGKLGYPYYAVYLEAPGVMPGSPEGERFLLSARKRKKSKTSNYLISIDLDDTCRQSANYFGKLRSNFVGTEFTVYDGGVKPSETTGAPDAPQARLELGAVLYQYNVLGTRGPRKMTAVVPRVSDKGERHPVQAKTDKDKEQILRRHKERGDISEELVTMINKPPKWNDQMQAYCLNFNGRVTKASVKNFQLASGDALDHVILQFGKVGKDAFTMDYAWPINALQAFAICLTSFDNKLARRRRPARTPERSSMSRACLALPGIRAGGRSLRQCVRGKKRCR